MKPESKQKTIFGVHRYKIAAIVLVGIPLLVLTLITSVAILRALIVTSSPSNFSDVFDDHVADMVDDGHVMARAERLAGALRIETINYEPGKQEFGELINFHRYLEENFPLIHSSDFISREVVNDYSLLYTVQGSAEGAVPYLLLAHLDVVPADPTTWDVPPFSGNIVDGKRIFGRGALDDKAIVMGMLEALEYTLQSGQRPKKSFYIALGHDEESGGDRGAQELAKTLRSRGVKQVDFILDEGFPMTRGVLPGTNKNIATIGVTEKGSTSLMLTVMGTPGHSSIPPRESAIGILAAAIAKLEQHPQPSMFGTGPEAQMFAQLAPHCTFGYRLLYSNLWLSSGLLARQMSKKPSSDAMLRTSIAITIFNGGIKENTVPGTATALINLHVHPSQTVAHAVNLVRETIGDSRVLMSVRKGKITREAHPVSPSGPEVKQYQMLTSTIRQVFDDSVVVPGVVVGNTDTRWYLDLSRHIYRMYPISIAPEDFAMAHGNNEHITVDQYSGVVKFYYRVIKNADLL